MKFILKLLLFLGAAFLFSLLLLKPVVAQAPTQSNRDYESGPLVIKNDAIQSPSPSGANDISATRQPTINRVETGKLTPQPAAGLYSGRNYSKEEVERLIQDYSAQYGVNVELAKRIAWCESGYNQMAKNRSSTASGVYQYLSSTWANTPAGRSGVSVFDAESNVRMAIASIASTGTAPWASSKSCWNK